MANGKDDIMTVTPALSAEANTEIGVLKSNVRALDDDFRELKGIVNDLARSISSRDAALHTKIDTFAAATNTQINTFAAAINTKIDQSKSPQWQMYSVFLVGIIAIGGLVYWPVKEKTADLHESQVELSHVLTSFMLDAPNKFASDKIMASTRDRIDHRIDELLKVTVPRAEHDGRWAAYDRAQIDLHTLIDKDTNSLQRQIDDVNRRTGITTADVITRLENQVHQLSQDFYNRGKTP